MTVFSFSPEREQKTKRLLLIATGALTNSTSSQQGESIPGIAHAISIDIEHEMKFLGRAYFSVITKSEA